MIQLKNKWDLLKRDWKLWRDLKQGSTGLGWNPMKRTIDASDDWWNEKLKVFPQAKKFKNNGIDPEMESKLNDMFLSIAATGDYCWGPGFGEMPSDMANENEEYSEQEEITNSKRQSLEEEESPQPSLANKRAKELNSLKGNSIKKIKRSSVGGSQLLSSQIQALVNAVQSRISGSQTTWTISNALDKLHSIMSIENDPELYWFAVDMVQNAKKREVFMHMEFPLNYEFVKREYEKKESERSRAFSSYHDILL
ncbi:hypothetical protein AXF42_Ash005965 [Apostasia shenzhenica]|uniref:Myb/SANT-like domain-containing protein n=1 Tax=Apostasia shenzhenica TaxID=1088818 RepID=A0A2I0AZV8_9ASPA|nr:hypothetical protein AXF42_Ash005965 [Apostasia shenzhenica]